MGFSVLFALLALCSGQTTSPTVSPSPTRSTSTSLTPSSSNTPSQTPSFTQTPSAVFNDLCIGCPSIIFTPSTSYKYFTAPLVGLGSKYIYIQVWGAGGGSGRDFAGSGTTYGGVGAYTSGIYPVSGNTTLQIIVGAKGLSGSPSTSSADTLGCCGGVQCGRSGGGRSAIQINSTAAASNWTEIMTAGGGGGSGYSQNGGSALGNSTPCVGIAKCGATFSTAGYCAGSGGGGACGGSATSGASYLAGNGGSSFLASPPLIFCGSVISGVSTGAAPAMPNFPSNWDGLSSKPSNDGRVVVSLLPPTAPFNTSCPHVRICPAGSICSADGSSSYCLHTDSCISCPVGYYCPINTMNATLNLTICPPGTYRAVAGGAVLSDCRPCPGGHYCPSGTSSWARFNCGRGNYCPEGSGAPTSCPYQVPPSDGWGAVLAQGPAFLLETAQCLNHCFWNLTTGEGLLSKC